MDLLTKWLHKRGFKDATELDDKPLPDGSPSERQVFEQYREILNKDELTVPDIKAFCNSQISLIESKWADLSLESQKKAELIPYHTIYRSLLTAIDSPKVAKESAIRSLTELTK